MQLTHLGFDRWLETEATIAFPEGQRLARVMTVDRGSFLVRNQEGEMVAEISGKFRFSVDSGIDLPCVGDWVCLEQDASSPALIHTVLPRKTFLRRKHPGRAMDFQMIAANLDIAFIVKSCHYDFSVRRLERYLVAAKEGNIEPVIILTKTDLVAPEELEEQIKQIREADIFAKIFPISNANGSGLDQFRNLLVPGKTFCLIGSSGVGKTTIVNRLIGRDVLETKAVSVTGEGVHTTSRRQLHILPNGALLVDTPGMREIGLIGVGEAVEDNFSDINDLLLCCRFPDCTHTQEPGCAILRAIEAGELRRDRYESFMKLKKETDFHDLSYVEKRNKNKKFGRFVKSVKKHHKKR